MSEPTKAPWELLRIGTPIEDWSGAQYVIRSDKAPGGIAIVVGGLGAEEELANAQLIEMAGNNARLFSPAVGAALRSIVLDYARGEHHTEIWEDLLTGDTVTLTDLLLLLMRLPGLAAREPRKGSDAEI